MDSGDVNRYLKTITGDKVHIERLPHVGGDRARRAVAPRLSNLRVRRRKPGAMPPERSRVSRSSWAIPRLSAERATSIRTCSMVLRRIVAETHRKGSRTDRPGAPAASRCAGRQAPRELIRRRLTRGPPPFSHASLLRTREPVYYCGERAGRTQLQELEPMTAIESGVRAVFEDRQNNLLGRGKGV